METKRTKVVKIYNLKNDDEKVLWGKGYKEIVICENNDSIWTNEELEIEFEISEDGTMRIVNGNNWIWLGKESIPLLKEAIVEFEKVVK